jgi:glycosyltransferase involved in cell wall biosynthesis
MSPTRVAMVSSRYSPLVGRVETHVQEVARRISAKGLDLTVLTTDLTGELSPEEHDGALTVRRYPAWPKRFDLYVSPSLVRQIREGSYDLVHLQGVNNFLPPMALRAAQLSGVPTVNVPRRGPFQPGEKVGQGDAMEGRGASAPSIERAGRGISFRG